MQYQELNSFNFKALFALHDLFNDLQTLQTILLIKIPLEMTCPHFCTLSVQVYETHIQGRN